MNFFLRFHRVLEYTDPPPYAEKDKHKIPDGHTNLMEGSRKVLDYKIPSLRSRMRKRIEDLEEDKVVFESPSRPLFYIYR